MTMDNGLDHSIGFQMGVTYRKLSTILLQRLKVHDITPEQWSVLYQVQRAEGSMQKELAERTAKDRPTTTRILDQLESKGYIFKKSAENDRRSFLVYSTDQGKALIQETLPIEQQVIREVKACMTQTEYDLLLDLLLRINRRVSELKDKD